MIARWMLLLVLILGSLLIPLGPASATTVAKTPSCYHASGFGWRFTMCVHPISILGVVGKASWRGQMPGFLGHDFQHPGFPSLAPHNP
jgi:hypothetical protein